MPPEANEARDDEEESENPGSLPVDVAGYTVELFYHEDTDPIEERAKTWKDGEMNMKVHFENMRALNICLPCCVIRRQLSFSKCFSTTK